MKFKSIKINQLESGTKINGIYILRKKELRDTNAGKKYIDLTFIDDTGNSDQADDLVKETAEFIRK